MRQCAAVIVLSCVFLTHLPVAHSAGERKELVLGFLPVFSYTETLNRAKPLRAYLEQELDVPVSIIISKDMDDYLRNAREGKIDVLYINPPVFIKLAPKAGERGSGVGVFARVINLDGFEKFRGVIATRADSPTLQTIKDITKKGVKGMCTAKNSASGYTSQKFFLAASGIDIASLDIKISPTQKHEEVVLALFNGEVDFGMYREDAPTLLKDMIDLSQIKVLAYGEWIPEWCFCLRQGLDGPLGEKVKAALYKLTRDEPRYWPVLDALKIRALVPAQDNEWNEYRALCDKTDYAY